MGAFRKDVITSGNENILNNAGYNELIIKNNCDYGVFYDYAEKLAVILNIQYKNKVDGLDDFYWDFDFEDCEMVLCYNVYLGISICPLKFKNASSNDNEKLYQILKVLNNS